MPGYTEEVEPLHTVQRVADLLGVRRKTVYRMIAAGKITVLRFGRKVIRVSDAELRRLLGGAT